MFTRKAMLVYIELSKDLLKTNDEKIRQRKEKGLSFDDLLREREIYLDTIEGFKEELKKVE